MSEHPFAARVAARLSFAVSAVAATALLAACGSRQPAPPEPPPATATPRNSVVMPAVAYGTTAKGVQLTKADDACDVPASLRQAVQDQLLDPYEFVLAPPAPAAAQAAPSLKLEITDLLANAGGLYGGPKIVQLRGTLERQGEAPARFTAQRQMFIYFGMPRSTCSMVGVVTYKLGEDIAQWLLKPLDGAVLGER
ncbi:hypothetical protein SAMN05216567_12354 [Variovorax sp. OK605]|jgi:hypothetical protein|uniref:hypothetical protein n=1 Tax=unclassified Variovorax TaxID=663243 RepID=UPI0008D0F7AB|nr:MULTISPECIES: hypothetical protein [unclassified Variovorax]SEK16077.1 hypothetical protein SAMN05518853_12155 [Variovorax sp. OK202]SFE31435.1 hypothetical protein SAMN05444746_12155 [Variovorax sp. OK212]SFQ63939.1 hypothetical protein SAMN05216567_12354 [Variovorax sp. OK605]